MNSVLIKWLYLPDFFRAPNSTNLISEYPPAGPLVHIQHLPASVKAREVLPGDRQRANADPPLQPARGALSRPCQLAQSCGSPAGSELFSHECT